VFNPIRCNRLTLETVSRFLTSGRFRLGLALGGGDLLQFHQNAPGYQKGSRLIVGYGIKPPTELAQRSQMNRAYIAGCWRSGLNARHLK